MARVFCKKIRQHDFDNNLCYHYVYRFYLNSLIMSGGYFNYEQFKIGNIQEEIQFILDSQGNPIPEEELEHSPAYYQMHPDELLYPTLSPEIKETFIQAIYHLKMSKLYINSIDYYISGDDNAETYLIKLKKKLNHE